MARAVFAALRQTSDIRHGISTLCLGTVKLSGMEIGNAGEAYTCADM